MSNNLELEVSTLSDNIETLEKTIKVLVDTIKDLMVSNDIVKDQIFALTNRVEEL